MALRYFIWSLYCLVITASIGQGAPVKIARSSVLPCDHPFRIVVPSLFTHCDCSYSTWSNWIAVEGSIAKVPNSQCISGETYQEERTRVVIGGSECNERLNETRYTCKL